MLDDGQWHEQLYRLTLDYQGQASVVSPCEPVLKLGSRLRLLYWCVGATSDDGQAEVVALGVRRSGFSVGRDK